MAFGISSPPLPSVTLRGVGAIVLISRRLDRVKMSLAAVDVVFGRDDATRPARASRYFSGILGEYLSRSFCPTTPTNSLGRAT